MLLCTVLFIRTLISILLIYSVTDALNVYMYVMYLVFETFHMQELYPTTLYRLHSSELHYIGCIVVSFQGGRDCAKGGRMHPPPPLNEAVVYTIYTVYVYTVYTVYSVYT